MKPQDLYSGNAPTAMAQMGQGLAQAGANIANIQNQGSSAMTSGLMGGVNTALNQYQQYESAKTSNDITRSMIKDPEYGKLLGLDPSAEDYEDRKKSLLSKLDQQIKAHGQIGGAQFSKQFLGPIQEYATIGRQYKQQMDIKNAEIQAQRQQPFYVMGAQALGQAAADQQDNPQKRYGFSEGRSAFAPQQLTINPKTYLGR